MSTLKPINLSSTNNEHVKILFRFHSDLYEREMTETMWATIVDEKKGLYKLDNIPFYAPLIASDDVVFAEYDETEEFLTYRKTVEHSGNTTVHVVLMDESVPINDIREIFKELGCASEGFDEYYFAMEVPASTNYAPIKAKLNELESKDIIGHSEACLSEKHREEGY